MKISEINALEKDVISNYSQKREKLFDELNSCVVSSQAERVKLKDDAQLPKASNDNIINKNEMEAKIQELKKKLSILTDEEVEKRIKLKTAKLRETFFDKLYRSAVGFSGAVLILILLNYYDKLGMSDAVIIALMVQIPIQLISILLVIAKNLFPEKDNQKEEI